MQGAHAARQLIIARGLDHALRRVAAAVARRARSKVTGSGGLELGPCARSTPLRRCQSHASKRAPGGRCLHVDCCAAANWRSAAPQYVCRGTRHPPALFLFCSCSRVPSLLATAATGAGAATWCNPPAGSSSVACTPAIVLPLATCTLGAVSAWMRLHAWRARLSSTKYPAVSRRHGVGISDSRL